MVVETMQWKQKAQEAKTNALQICDIFTGDISLQWSNQTKAGLNVFYTNNHGHDTTLKLNETHVGMNEYGEAKSMEGNPKVTKLCITL